MIGSIVAFLSPLWPFLILVFCLVIADSYTGVKAAKKRKEEITSRGLSRTLDKIVLYCGAILLAHGMSVALMPAINLAWLPTIYICITEAKSYSENTFEITGVDVFKSLLAVLSSRLGGK